MVMTHATWSTSVLCEEKHAMQRKRDFGSEECVVKRGVRREKRSAL
jgi:hypothetical protein